MSFFSTLINMAQKSTELSKKVEKHMQKEKPSVANPKAAKESAGQMSSAEKDLYDNNVFGYRDRKDYMDYQQELLSKVNKAREDYKNGGDIDDIIKVYEYAFKESDPPCESSQEKYLITLYFKKKDYDKAWEYLQMLKYRCAKLIQGDKFGRYITLQQYYAEESDIENYQARILKQEKRYEQAIQSYMLVYVDRVWGNIDNTFNEDAFYKDIKTCADKLKWDEEKREYLAYLAKNSAARKDFNGMPMIDAYNKFLEDITRKQGKDA